MNAKEKAYQQRRDRALGALLRYILGAAPWGARGRTMRFLSSLTGLHAATLYRIADLDATPRPRGPRDKA